MNAWDKLINFCKKNIVPMKGTIEWKGKKENLPEIKQPLRTGKKEIKIMMSAFCTIQEQFEELKIKFDERAIKDIDLARRGWRYISYFKWIKQEVRDDVYLGILRQIEKVILLDKPNSQVVFIADK